MVRTHRIVYIAKYALVANGSKDIKSKKKKKKKNRGYVIQIKMFSHSMGPVHTKTILMLYITFLRGS
jgi:hypothetical protein